MSQLCSTKSNYWTLSNGFPYFSSIFYLQIEADDGPEQNITSDISTSINVVDNYDVPAVHQIEVFCCFVYILCM